MPLWHAGPLYTYTRCVAAHFAKLTGDSHLSAKVLWTLGLVHITTILSHVVNFRACTTLGVSESRKFRRFYRWKFRGYAVNCYEAAPIHWSQCERERERELLRPLPLDSCKQGIRPELSRIELKKELSRFYIAPAVIKKFILKESYYESVFFFQPYQSDILLGKKLCVCVRARVCFIGHSKMRYGLFHEFDS